MGQLPSFSKFQAMVSRVLDEVPEPLLAGLNGGVVVSRKRTRRAGDPAGVLVMGEYVIDPWLGSQIVLYYGSFRALLGADPDAWESELRETLVHEIRHHVEGRAGLEDLTNEDRQWIERLRRHQGG
jgi:predicted Zn-dependent protease with MMP-like domain